MPLFQLPHLPHVSPTFRSDPGGRVSREVAPTSRWCRGTVVMAMLPLTLWQMQLVVGKLTGENKGWTPQRKLYMPAHMYCMSTLQDVLFLGFYCVLGLCLHTWIVLCGSLIVKSSMLLLVSCFRPNQQVDTITWPPVDYIAVKHSSSTITLEAYNVIL